MHSLHPPSRPLSPALSLTAVAELGARRLNELCCELSHALRQEEGLKEEEGGE
jgi:hypothetical protein